MLTGSIGNCTDSPMLLVFYEHISLFICLQLQGHLHKEEDFQAKDLSYEMPVKVVACVVLPSVEALVLFPCMKGFFCPSVSLHVALFYSYFNEADEQEDCV